MAFPPRVTEIVCDRPEKEKRRIRIYQNKTEVEKKKEAQMSLGLLLLFLSEGTKPRQWGKPWYLKPVVLASAFSLSFSPSPNHSQKYLLMTHLPDTNTPSPALCSVIILPECIQIYPEPASSSLFESVCKRQPGHLCLKGSPKVTTRAASDYRTLTCVSIAFSM